MTFSEQDGPENAPCTNEAPEADNDTSSLLKIQALEAERDENHDKYMRSVAEFANYRKRIERDRAQQNWRQKADIISRFLEVLDDFERASLAIPESENDDAWVEGIFLVERKLRSALEELQVHHFESVGKPFDPNLHSALMEYESTEYPKGVVMAELKKGYMMNDQVLRHAMVQVSSGAPTDKNE